MEQSSRERDGNASKPKLDELWTIVKFGIGAEFDWRWSKIEFTLELEQIKIRTASNVAFC